MTQSKRLSGINAGGETAVFTLTAEQTGIILDAGLAPLA